MSTTAIAWFDDIGLNDIAQVGGKNAGLGELRRSLTPLGVPVPNGFALTAIAYHEFVRVNGLNERIAQALADWQAKRASLADTGAQIRAAFMDATWPPALARELKSAYQQLADSEGRPDLAVAVRSSATAEDLPDASFAGQQDSFLNIAGERALLDACRRCFASLFNDRAIVYRETHGFDQTRVALSIGVQTLVCPDPGASGVMFTLDTETGFSGVVLINASYGLGEYVVQGRVTPDEFVVWKQGLRDASLSPIIGKRCGAKERTLRIGVTATTIDTETPAEARDRYCISDDDVLRLARWAVLIEQKMGRPMDIEWVKDSTTKMLFIVQARPETVHAKHTGAPRRYVLTDQAEPVLRGRSVGNAIVSGSVCLVSDAAHLGDFVPGSILVTDMTDPDWVPIMRQARGIITNRGGRTCHAAIVSRELGIPAAIGTSTATSTLADGQSVTIDCATSNDASVYRGALAWREEVLQPSATAPIATRIMLNLAQPDAAFASSALPVDGVGLVRVEFIIGSTIGIHPMALVRPEILDDATRAAIAARHRGYEDGAEFFVETLARGIGMIAASQFPKPVIVRTSDFKTNEYARLLGGAAFEPREENPMIGFRGAARYYDERYRAGFALECRAIAYARDVLGLTNIAAMIPFCRTPQEADRVLEVMAANGVGRGAKGLRIYVMCELPSNVILAEQFAQRFDGFSIGSNDLTQLTLGVDRDSEILAKLFDERDLAVMTSITDVIRRAHACGITVGLCGQAPSDDPAFAEALVAAGIDSISVDPSSAVIVRERVAAFEARLNGVRRAG